MPRDPHLDRRHLLRVTLGVDKFRELIAAMRQDGAQVGWLELADVSPPPSLEEAAESGVLRAVAAGGDRTVVTKPRRGPAVVRDLVREHFRGCAVILVRGDVEAPLLTPEEGAWVVGSGDATDRFSTTELVSAVRRPRPWAGA